MEHFCWTFFHCLLTTKFCNQLSSWVRMRWEVGCLEEGRQFGHVSIQLELFRLKCHVPCNVVSGPFNQWSTWVTLTLHLRTKSSKLKEGYWRLATAHSKTILPKTFTASTRVPWSGKSVCRVVQSLIKLNLGYHEL